MYKSTFHIKQMDCPSEERLIRMKLSLLSTIHKLEFNIPDRTMVAYHSGEAQEILSLLQPLNFGSVLKETALSDESLLPSEDNNAEARVLKILLAINGGMFLVELFFGIFAESMGLLSDSFDMLADASVYLISLYAVGKTLEAKKRSARVNGTLQIIIGISILIETMRRFFFGSDPEPTFMIAISLMALLANIYSLSLLSGHKEKGAHMKASYICSSTDVIANAGVILAGILVMLTGSSVPDLIIGLVVVGFVLKGASSILSLAK